MDVCQDDIFLLLHERNDVKVLLLEVHVWQVCHGIEVLLVVNLAVVTYCCILYVSVRSVVYISVAESAESFSCSQSSSSMLDVSYILVQTTGLSSRIRAPR